MFRHISIVALATFLAVSSTPVLAQGFLDRPLAKETGTGQAIEADHIVVNGTVFALYGIEAPLRIQGCVDGQQSFPCGIVALEVLEEILAEGEVTCQEERDDHLRRRMLRYGRCTIGSIDVGAEMVRRGMAMAFPDQSDEYIELEQTARETQTGLWAADHFEPPWLWEQRRQDEL